MLTDGVPTSHDLSHHSLLLEVPAPKWEEVNIGEQIFQIVWCTFLFLVDIGFAVALVALSPILHHFRDRSEE